MDATPKPAKSLQYYMRATHRVIGYLVFGLVVIYALSGITLIHRTGDFMKKSTHTEEALQPGLSPDELGSALKMKYFKATDETQTTIYFTDGQYDKDTGKATYLKKEVVAPLNKFIDLHKLPVAKNHVVTIFTTIFGIALFLLAITALFMFKPAAKQFKANMIYVGAGIIAAVLRVIFA